MFASVLQAGDQSRDFFAPFVGQMSYIYVYTVHIYIYCIYRYTAIYIYIYMYIICLVLFLKPFLPSGGSAGGSKSHSRSWLCGVAPRWPCGSLGPR